ncbi:MAG: peptidoglycan DD-metalloendopeptidase family protein [Wenzhouxiangellaceae bacterium]|nr:peptidoglycan DD-metalloendopeptidase family protein [Wenzhouxiangellaceae bacterium]
MAAPAHSQNAPRSAEQVEQELLALRAEIERIGQSLSTRSEQRLQSRERLASSERRLAEVSQALYRTRAALEAGRARETALQHDIEAAEAAIEDTRGALEAQLQLAYRHGMRSRLQALLEARDPAALQRVLALHGYLGRTRLERIERLSQQRQVADALQREQASLIAELRAREQLREQQLTEQQAAIDTRRDALAALDLEIEQSHGRLSELQQTATELETLLEQLSRALADVPGELAVTPFEELRGELAMPADAPLRATFHSARNAEVRWQGWLLDVTPGSTIQAVAHGRVAWADWLRGYGMLVILDHGDEYMTLYGHNRALLVETGDWVTPDQPIALAGDAEGNLPGLYFQIRHAGQPIDPSGWIRR